MKGSFITRKSCSCFQREPGQGLLYLRLLCSIKVCPSIQCHLNCFANIVNFQNFYFKTHFLILLMLPDVFDYCWLFLHTSFPFADTVSGCCTVFSHRLVLAFSWYSDLENILLGVPKAVNQYIQTSHISRKWKACDLLIKSQELSKESITSIFKNVSLIFMWKAG